MKKREIPVNKLHEEIIKIKNYKSMDEVIDAASSLFPFDIDGALTRDLYQKSRKEFENELSLDITVKLARWFTPRLFGWIENQGSMKTFRDLLKMLGTAYSQITKPWSSLFTSYVFTALSISKEYGAKEAWIISRDASPLFLIAIGIRDKIKWDGGIRLVECNRDLFGIPAVFDPKGKETKRTATSFGKSPEEVRKLPIYSYLKKIRGATSKKITWIETGYHGTLIKKIADLDLLGDVLVFFLSSSNPNILGYANILVIYENLKKRQIPDDFIYILGDQIESLPKFYKNVQILKYKKGIKLVAEPVNPIYKFCSMVSYWTLFNESLNIDPKQVDSLMEVRKLYKLYLKVVSNPNELPFVLPECIPGWKDGITFLKNEFNLGPLLPMRDWWGP